MLVLTLWYLFAVQTSGAKLTSTYWFIAGDSDDEGKVPVTFLLFVCAIISLSNITLICMINSYEANEYTATPYPRGQLKPHFNTCSSCDLKIIRTLWFNLSYLKLHHFLHTTNRLLGSCIESLKSKQSCTLFHRPCNSDCTPYIREQKVHH